LRAVVDYTEIHGLWKVQLSALELVLRITELQESGDFSEAIVVLSRLVLQYCRLGHCRKASSLLSRADQCLSENEVSCLATLSYKLARTEYLLETGDVEKAASVIANARMLYEKYQKQHDLSDCSVLSKISWERLVADAAFINSRLSFAQGSITHALFFAKLSVRLNCRVWAKVEKLSQRKQGKALQASSNNPELDSMIDGVAKLDVSQTSPSTPDSAVSYFQGAPFWPHIGSHHTSLLNLASLSAHHGLFQDAVYYGEQALKVNKTLNANVRLVESQTQLGSHWVFGGHVAEGQELLESAAEIAKQFDSSIELILLQMSLASLHRAQGQYRDEHSALQEADKVMNEVIASELSDNASVSSSVDDLEEKMDKLRIRAGSRRAQQPTTTTTTRRTRATSASTRSASRKTPSPSEDSAVESKSLLQLRTDLLRQQAGCSRALRDFDAATDLLGNARQYALSRDSQIALHLGESEHFLADAIRNFATHSVYCVLPESTISLPSLESPKKGGDDDDEEPSNVKTPATRRTRAPARNPRSKTPKTSEDFAVMLSKAGDCLGNIFPTATTIGSTLDSHAASRLMSRISMLSQTTAPGSTPGPDVPANVNEIGRIGAFNRERVAIDLDKQLADFSDPLLWPTTSSTAAEAEEDLYSNFTKDYVDILPENWNVLSLSLSADST
ncbi:separin protein, partial [Elasticomyces elasticus]